MSSISELKAIELYPENKSYYRIEGYIDVNKEERVGYIKGYDQAMKDIKEFIYDKFNIHPHDCHVVQYDSDTPIESMDDFVKQIESYIENEM